MISIFDLFKKALPKPAFLVRSEHVSKHQASKRGYSHQATNRVKRRGPVLTQHQRVVNGRAKRLGLSIVEYETKFGKGE